MASVTQCDVCKNVVKHEESKYIRIYDVNEGDKITASLGIEVCHECYEKVAKILNIN